MSRGIRTHEDGFTLVEVLTVLVIIGILVATAVATYVLTGERSRTVTCRQNQSVLESAVGQYQAAHAGVRPTDIDELEPYVRWSGPGFAKCVSSPYPKLHYNQTTGDVWCETPGH